MTTGDDGEDVGPCASPPCFLHEVDPAYSGLTGQAAPSRGRDGQPLGRLVPERPFPPYAYLPGRFPHPVRDPQGHSYAPRPAPRHPGAATDPDTLRWGMDLFNHGFYWEAHEVWEDLWRGASKGTAAREVLHGLILLAAAGVKLREGKPGAAHRHGTRAASLFRLADGGRDPLGPDLALSPASLAALAEKAVTSPPGTPDRMVVFDFVLGLRPPKESVSQPRP